VTAARAFLKGSEMFKTLWCSIFHQQFWMEINNPALEPTLVMEIQCAKCGSFHFAAYDPEIETRSR
jgi:hypothetical protein